MTDYERVYREHADYFGDKPSPLLVEHAGLIPTGGRVLDIGVGQGRHALYLARRGYQVTGIDPAAASIEGVRRRAGDEGVAIDLWQGTFQDFEPGPEPFAAILAFGLLQSLTRNEGAMLLHRLRAWTRRGGLVFLTAWHVDDPSYEAVSAAGEPIGLHSFQTDGGRVRSYLGRGEIRDLMLGWWQVHYWEGLGPEHSHADGPPERHGAVEMVAARLK